MFFRASIGGLIAAFVLCAAPVTAKQMWSFHGAEREFRGTYEVASVPSVPQPREPDDVMGLALRNNGTSRAFAPVTMGQVFSPGALPKDSGLVAKFEGRQVPVQMDVKATNPDGSVRMAVLTFTIPPLGAGDTLPVMLAKSAPASDEPFQSSNFPNVVLTLDIHGEQKYSFDITDLLAKALKAGHLSYWLKGPQAVEVRLDRPVTGSLHVTFDVRRYASGDSIIDVEFKNDYAFQAIGGPLTYDVAIKKDDVVVFSAPDITQPQYTQWHKKIMIGNASDVQMIFDLKALEKTGAILDYDPNASLSGLIIGRERKEIDAGTGFGILGNAGLALFMPMTGLRADIGPTTQANTLWLTTQDRTAAEYALAQADAAGSIPWHFFDPKIGNYRTATAYPKLWFDRLSKFGLTQPVPEHTKTCQCWATDVAHQPDLSFIPYLLTGSRYYLDQIEAQATWNVLAITPQQRGDSEGLVVSPHFQIRAQAWALRTVINAAWIVPDSDPLKTYFLQIQHNNFVAFKNEVDHLHEGEASGWFPGYGGGRDRGTISPWQEDYIGATLLLALKHGVPLARELVDWQTHFLAGRLLAGGKGFPPFDGVGYRIAIWLPPSPTDNPLTTWHEIATANVVGGWSGNGTWTHGTYVPYVKAARGVLAEIANLTGSAAATKAHEWLAAQGLPPRGTRVDLADPTWDIGPNP